jgi:predicted  nucleic acid-binding Zn-ribbon protein
MKGEPNFMFLSEAQFKQLLETIQTGDKQIMAALDDLKSEITALNTSVSAEINAATTAIQNAVAANNGSVSAADAEAIVTQLKQTQATLDAETAALTTPTPAPPATT